MSIALDGVKTCFCNICVYEKYDNGRTPLLNTLNIVTHDPQVFLQLYRWLRSVYPTVYHITRLYMMYDMEMWAGSSNTMSRRLRRLRKLLKMIEALETVLVVGPTTCTIRYTDIARPVVDIITGIYSVASSYEKHEARTRRIVHEYLYPILANALEALTAGNLILRGQNKYSGIYYGYVYYFGSERIYFHVENKKNEPLVLREATEKEIELLARHGDNADIVMWRIALKALFRAKQKDLLLRNEEIAIPRWFFELG